MRKRAPERLIDEMLKRAQQLAAFAAQKRRVFTVQLQQTAFGSLGNLGAEIEFGPRENIVQKCLRLLASLVHNLHSLAIKFPREQFAVKSELNC
jgi:hypothetical protein